MKILRYKKKKNNRRGNINLLIFFGIIVIIGILFSAGSIGRFFMVCAIETFCAGAFWLLANIFKNKNKNRVRRVNKKADLKRVKDTIEVIKEKSIERDMTSSFSKKNNRNFDWVIKKEDTRVIEDEIIEEAPALPQRDIKAEVANWSKMVHYSGSVFDNIMQKTNQQTHNEDVGSIEEKREDTKEEIYTEAFGKFFEPQNDYAEAAGSIGIEMYIDTPDEENKHLENETIELVIDKACEDLRDELGNQNDEYSLNTDKMEDIKDLTIKSDNSLFLPQEDKKTIVKGYYKSKQILHKKTKISVTNKKAEIQTVESFLNYNINSGSMPTVELLIKSKAENESGLSDYNPEDNAVKLIDTLASFGVGAKIINISKGPAVTRYELQPDYGVKVSKIVNLTDDIALNLAATGVRIEAPIPGKAAIGIEIPNKEVTPVFLRDVIESDEFMNHPSKLAFAVGKDVTGNVVIADIAKMPHLLIAGATGSGKSVCINTLITSILYKASPSEVKLLMVDPKVVELSIYNGIPHLLIPVVTDPKKAAGALNWAVQEMTGRYKLFADNNVRDLKGYNLLVTEKGNGTTLPQIVIIVDELADLMMVAPNDVEDCICRLAQMARAAGMHLVIATQRPSVDVITGVIKANVPSRISFAVSSQIDSRTILDIAGAEKLLGRGDMLFSPVGMSKPVRVQGGLITDKEVEAIVSHIKNSESSQYDADILEKIEKQTEPCQTDSDDDDELLPQVINMVIEQGQASTSLIQRKFKLGYSRAARILDQMEASGIVGPFEGSKPRKILVTKQQWMEMI